MDRAPQERHDAPLGLERPEGRRLSTKMPPLRGSIPQRRGS